MCLYCHFILIVIKSKYMVLVLHICCLSFLCFIYMCDCCFFSVFIIDVTRPQSLLSVQFEGAPCTCRLARVPGNMADCSQQVFKVVRQQLCGVTAGTFCSTVVVWNIHSPDVYNTYKFIITNLYMVPRPHQAGTKTLSHLALSLLLSQLIFLPL